MSCKDNDLNKLGNQKSEGLSQMMMLQQKDNEIDFKAKTAAI